MKYTRQQTRSYSTFPSAPFPRVNPRTMRVTRDPFARVNSCITRFTRLARSSSGRLPSERVGRAASPWVPRTCRRPLLLLYMCMHMCMYS
eukprot:scaffold93499_cov58-Phaeocystis_antarctica.AAC.1